MLHQTEDHRKRVLMSAQKEIRPWIIKVKKIKAIYHTLNMCNFDVSHNSLIAECWTPVSGLEEIQSALKHGTVSYQGHLWVTNVVWINLKTLHFLIFIWSMKSWTGAEWEHSSQHPPSDADQGSSANILQDQQVHNCIPRNYWCVWYRNLPGG